LLVAVFWVVERHPADGVLQTHLAGECPERRRLWRQHFGEFDHANTGYRQPSA
jgi:hypothetical protein